MSLTTSMPTCCVTRRNRHPESNIPIPFKDCVLCRIRTEPVCLSGCLCHENAGANTDDNERRWRLRKSAAGRRAATVFQRASAAHRTTHPIRYVSVKRGRKGGRARIVASTANTVSVSDPTRPVHHSPVPLVTLRLSRHSCSTLAGS